MGELLEYFKSKYKKNASSSEDQMIKTNVKNTISDLCEEHLEDIGDVFQFEVLPKDLPYVVTVIDEEPLKSKYIINQISKTLFEAILREVEI
ncbi:hypothetical protein ACEE21_14415 [Clostridium baratii]